MRKAVAIALLSTLPSLPALADVTDLVGETAPPVRARSVDADGDIGLDAYRGRVVVLAFVATWCAACRRMAPHLDALETAHAAEGLTVLALSHERREPIRRHLAQTPRSYRMLQCTGHTAVTYRASALPTIVIIGRDGRVAAAYQGATPQIAAAISRDVQRLL